MLRAWLLDLTEQVAWRLRRNGLRGRVIHLKVRFADFSTITRSQTVAEPTDITDELWQVADRMFRERLPAGHLPVRLLGMGVAGLDASGVRQGLLFDQDERRKQSDMDATRDQIRERFGSSALRRAASLPHQHPP
jgi:DNA polymerase IV